MSNEHSRRNFLEGSGMAAAGALGAGLMTAGAAEAQTAAAAPSSMSKSARLKALVNKGDHFDAPFIPDVMCARLCEMVGYPAIFTGGNWAGAAKYGIPDFGLITITELIDFGANVAEFTNLPVIADGDDAGGSADNAYRATKRLVHAGLAGAMFEDTMQVKNMLPRVGGLVSQSEMVDKIKATRDASTDPNFVLIARSDASGLGHPMEEVMARGVAYAEAGADVIFFAGLPLEAHAKARNIVKKPLMTFPPVQATPQQVRDARITIAFRHFEYIGVGAIYQALQELKTTGMMTTSSKMNLPREVNEKLTETAEWIARGRKYNLLPMA